MKGIESLRIQSFKGFWKSRKIPVSDFENPGIRILKKSLDPGIPQGPGLQDPCEVDEMVQYTMTSLLKQNRLACGQELFLRHLTLVLSSVYGV